MLFIKKQKLGLDAQTNTQFDPIYSDFLEFQYMNSLFGDNNEFLVGEGWYLYSNFPLFFYLPGFLRSSLSLSRPVSLPNT